MSLEGFISAVKAVKSVHDNVQPIALKGAGLGARISREQRIGAESELVQAIKERDARLARLDRELKAESDRIVDQKVMEFLNRPDAVISYGI